MIARGGLERSGLVALWLFFVAFWVFAMVVVGGATRLTGSGLSITQWNPITGVVPPLTPQAWMDDFKAYQATSQYKWVNHGMSLDQFKFIYAWEWGHRFLGRMVGVVFAAPALAFVATGRMPRRLIWRCVMLFLLGGAQGVVGWWMVRSGLEGRVSVAPERLATHLGLAMALFSALIWTGLDAWRGPNRRPRRDGWSLATATLASLVFLQCLMGALVAGNHGGKVDNDWPLMGGHWFPVDYWRGGVWTTLAHGPAAGQFNHRLGAYVLACVALGLATAAIRSARAPGSIRLLAGLAACFVVGQALLGVATLVWAAPLLLALAHQALAGGVLAICVILAWRGQRQ